MSVSFKVQFTAGFKMASELCGISLNHLKCIYSERRKVISEIELKKFTGGCLFCTLRSSRILLKITSINSHMNFQIYDPINSTHFIYLLIHAFPGKIQLLKHTCLI